VLAVIGLVGAADERQPRNQPPGKVEQPHRAVTLVGALAGFHRQPKQ
jgi:hypothetical protein